MVFDLFFLPFEDVHLLLSNVLAGDKVVVKPLLTNIPCIDQPPDHIEQEIPDLYPSCAITRAMAKKAKQNGGEIDLSYTYLGQPFKHEITDRQVISQSPVITLQYEITRVKVMTWCQGHDFARNSIMILNFCLCLKGLLMRMK